jgi:hypothetical protein
MKEQILQLLKKRGHSNPNTGIEKIEYQGKLEDMVKDPLFLDAFTTVFDAMAYETSASVYATDMQEWLEEKGKLKEWDRTFKQWDKIHTDVIRKAERETLKAQELKKFMKATRQLFKIQTDVFGDNLDQFLRNLGPFQAGRVNGYDIGRILLSLR